MSKEPIELLAEMEAFRDSSARGDASAEWWDKMDQEFHRVMKELMHHEQRERDLLQEAFSDDIGTGDSFYGYKTSDTGNRLVKRADGRDPIYEQSANY